MKSKLSAFRIPHSAFHSAVAEAIEATRICSPTTYSWFGTHSEQLPLHLRRALPPAIGRNYLLANLQDQLYRDFYCPGGARPALGLPLAGDRLGVIDDGEAIPQHPAP